MNNQQSQNKQEYYRTNTTEDSFLSTFMQNFNKSWQNFDREFDEIDKRIKERKKLNGKATHHEIDL